MRRNRPGTALSLFWTLLFAGTFTACGGNETQQNNVGNNNPPPTIQVVVTPNNLSVDQGGTLQFTATVLNASNRVVSWSIQEANGGTISSQGLYTAPAAAGTFHIIATSEADSSKSATALVEVPSVTVGMYPASVGVPRARTRQFTAFVLGTINTNIKWSVEEGPAGGTITPVGLYTAPTSGGPFHVVATAAADPTQSATTMVTLTDSGFRVLASPMSTRRIRHSATLLPNGRVLLAGGLACDEDSCDYSSTAELFDPTTETFTPTGSLIRKRAGHTATLLANGTVLVTGGDLELKPSSEIYNPATGTFTAAPDMLEHRRSHRASRLADGRVLISGGMGGTDFDWWDFIPPSVQSAEVYDPAIGDFSAVGDLGVATGDHSASVLKDGKVLVGGGSDGSEGCRSNDYVGLFNPNTNQFTSTASLPGARAFHTATVLSSGKVLVAGGDDICQYDDFAAYEALIYDPAIAEFSLPMSMLGAHFYHTATLLPSGKVLLTDVTAELFDPNPSTFSLTGSPNFGRDYGAQSTLLQDGRVLVTGGSSERAEVYE